ncbi:MAG: hypothetical protein KDI44_08645 [Thiothrix sp.]|nr:hypothetical protein [Thiothrix sp.]HPQ94698.1 hypothetical protein [Thiolinea sp.]
MKWVYRLFLLSVLAILAWYSLAWRTASIGPSDFIDTNPLREPVTWNGSPLAHPDTWVKLSIQALAQGDEEKAYQEAVSALYYNPGNSRAAVQLMAIFKRRNQDDNAQKMAVLASNLWRADAYMHAQLANFWLSQNQPERVMNEWSQLIIHDPGKYQKELFPVFKTTLENSDGFTLLQPYMLAPPSWWNAFFSYLINQNTAADLITAIYQQRLQSETPISNSERRSLVRYLLKEQQYSQAYFLWLSGLDTESLKLNGIVHDGGFEGNSYNSGFDWQYRNQNGVKFTVTSTSGAKGKRALNLKLNAKNLNFQNLSQLLQIPPGSTYQLSFNYRLDRLETDGGLSWRIRCLENNQIIAESRPLSGRTSWNIVSLPFEVPPEGCSAQLLRLEASSPYAHRRNFKGSLWLDQIGISRENNR